MLNEETTPYREKNLDPALLTRTEWLKIVNSEGKHHPPSYSWSIRSDRYKKLSDYPELLFRKIINGLTFEFRLKTIDKMKGRYLKFAGDEFLRDEHGEPLYYTEEELRNGAIPYLITHPYDWRVGVFHDGQYVGGSQNEWGAMLISVADEYRGFGLGPIVAKLARERDPEKSSGGFTSAGKVNFLRVHDSMVRDYLKTGMYSHLVRKGVITLDRVKEIVGSIGERVKKKPEVNLNFTNSRDWNLYGDYGWLILYDRKILDLMGNERYEYFVEKAIRGVVFVDDRGRIISLYGADKKLHTLMLALAAQEENPLLIDKEDVQYVDDRFEAIDDMNLKAGYWSQSFNYRGKIISLQEMIRAEKAWRNLHDQHDEFLHTLQEMAHSLTH